MKHMILLCSLAAGLMAVPVTANADSDVSKEKASQNTPQGWQAVELPSIAAITDANTLNIKDYGASTTSADNTAAIQRALDAVPQGGGMVVVPAGTWLCGPLQVKANTVLHLAAGATLRLLPYGTYPSDNGNYKNKTFLANRTARMPQTSSSKARAPRQALSTDRAPHGGKLWNRKSLTAPPLSAFPVAAVSWCATCVLRMHRE